MKAAVEPSNLESDDDSNEDEEESNEVEESEDRIAMVREWTSHVGY